MRSETDRRAFLQRVSWAGAAAFWASHSLGRHRAAAAESTQAALLPGSDVLFRVRMQLEVEGNIHLARDPVRSREKARELPLQSESVLDYEERLTRDDSGVTRAARRYYYEAESEATTGGQTGSSRLRKGLRRLTARLSNGPEILYSGENFLNHEELDLLQSPLSSLALDRILPPDEVSVDETWTPEEVALARLLNLDAVQRCTVRGKVAELSDQQAKLQLTGRIDGAVDGVATGIDLAGKLTFDLQKAAVTWCALALREKREIGIGRPGFEVAATVKMRREPLAAANAVRNSEPVAWKDTIPRPRLLVNVRSTRTGFSGLLDRPWRVISDAPGQTTLRMVEADRAIAQCDVRPLPDMKPGQQLTLEAFQIEIRKTLGDQFGELLEAEEGLNGGGLRTLRVAVVGMVQQVPVQWVFLHFSDDSGRRLGATFSLESSQVDAFLGSDAQLANSLQFEEIEPPVRRAAQPASARNG
jgi:hypothetical protein